MFFYDPSLTSKRYFLSGCGRVNCINVMAKVEKFVHDEVHL